ncbi:MAG: alpha/beta hydrolase-fold protein [Thermoanaerobaculia bacterium]
MRNAPISPAAVAPLLALLLAPLGEAGEPPCGTLAQLRTRLAAAPDDGTRATAAAEVAACAARLGTPLLSPGSAPGRVRALFLFRSAAPRVFLAGDTNGWNKTSTPLEKLQGTDLHAVELELQDGARLDYKLVVGGTEWALDPWNPRTMAGGYGPNSELRTPAYVPPAEVEPRAGTPRGRYEDLRVASRALGGERRAIAWVPPGAAASSAPMPVLFLLDGTDYREFAKVHTVAENLLADGRTPPLLLVLVPPVDRRLEYERHEAFERFLVDELVPAVEARYRVRRDRDGRGVLGVSLGGFAALSAVARNAGTFGRCGAQSTASAVPANLDALLADLARLPAGTARFHLDVGTFEADLHGANLLAVSRRVRSALARGQRVQYRELPEGHSWGSWRARLAEALTYFWGDEKPPSSPEARALAAPPDGAERFTGAPTSLDVKDADLADVVRNLTAGRGLSVVAPGDLKGTVTATFRDVPWDQALDLALAGNGWTFVREGTVIRIVRRSDLAR